MIVRVSGHLDPHPWSRSTDLAEDAYSVCRARLELMGWDSTFSSAAGERQEIFGLIEAELTGTGQGDLGHFRVQPTLPGAVHRYLPALGVAVDDTIARFGVSTVTAVEAGLPAAPADRQSLPYLQQALNWFRAGPPHVGRHAELTCQGPPTTVQRGALSRLEGLALAPFAVESDTAVVHVPEWTVTAATWALSAVAAAVRETGFADGFHVELRVADHLAEPSGREHTPSARTRGG
ncbi:hypothetical protein [Thalassiella azotivora]